MIRVIKPSMGIRFFILSILLLLSAHLKAQSQCVDLFKVQIYKVNDANWNQGLFNKTVQQITTQKKLPTQSELQMVEVKLGLLQALIHRAGLSGEIKLQSLPKKIHLSGPVSQYKAEKLIQSLVSLQKEKMFFLKRWFAVHRKEVSEKHIDNYIKEQLLIYEFLKLLEANQLYKENSKIEKVLQFTKDHQSYHKVLTSILVNYFSIQWFGFPFYLPEFQFLHQVKLTPKELESLKAKPHNQKIQWVYKQQIYRVRLDRILNFPRDAFPAFMTLTLLYYGFNPVVQVPDYITTSTSSEIYQAWVEMYKAENGHYPNVFFNTSDRNQWSALYKQIVEQYSTH